MAKVAAAAVDAAHVHAGMRVVDLGCGGGRLALELARRGAVVLGVDVSDAMIARMTALAADEGITSVTGIVSPVERLSLAEDSVDLVIILQKF